MKIFFRNIHLYLSLTAGLVILTACFTGAILVFEKELQAAFNPERYYVESGQKRLPLEQLVSNVQKQSPEIKISSVKLYPEQNRTVEIGFTTKTKKDKKEEKPAQSAKKGEKPAEAKSAEGSKKTAFVNPYTGEVIELYSYRETFFYKVFALHRWLLGGNDSVGKLIVGISTLMFLFILITGLILWWPK
ncbi:MAG TPA: PepSY-associated TM helix domain-containing protein, partial [Daejeonella sp.]|nr:PepSY-associated TM helix domain-containing protein [Daejeonella sp.]